MQYIKLSYRLAQVERQNDGVERPIEVGTFYWSSVKGNGKGGKEQRFDIFTNFADGIKATESAPPFGRSQNGLSMESRPSGHHLDEAR